MKKILLFGKLNEITKDINHYLRDYFQVQLCSENVEIGIGMMKIYQPDAVIISLVGLYEAAHGSFFTDLYKNYRETPVIVIGTEKENNAFIPYWRGTQFSALSRPIDCGEIMQRLCEKIGLDMEQILREEEEKEKKHIILVDDNADFLRSMKKVLEDKYSVSLAISAAQAMTIMGKRKPDLMILDYDMPICDGKMMLEMIRADENLKFVPVIFLTGYSDREHVKAVLDLKPSGYFLKPPAYDKLLEGIAELLEE